MSVSNFLFDMRELRFVLKEWLDASFRKIRSLAQAVAQTDSTILITGETGILTLIKRRGS